MEQPAFASVAENLLDRHVGMLVRDIVRAAKTADKASSSSPQYTVVTNGRSFNQSGSKEELRGALHSVVRHRKREILAPDDDEIDAMARALRTGKKSRREASQQRPSRGFK